MHTIFSNPTATARAQNSPKVSDSATEALALDQARRQAVCFEDGAAAPAAKTAPQVRSTSSRCGSSKGPPMASDGAAGVAPDAKIAAPLEVLLSGRP